MRTQHVMGGRTESMVVGARVPSRTALATRSWRLAERIADPAQRAAAKARHFEEFVGPRTACPTHRG